MLGVIPWQVTVQFVRTYMSPRSWFPDAGNWTTQDGTGSPRMHLPAALEARFDDDYGVLMWSNMISANNCVEYRVLYVVRVSVCLSSACSHSLCVLRQLATTARPSHSRTLLQIPCRWFPWCSLFFRPRTVELHHPLRANTVSQSPSWRSPFLLLTSSSCDRHSPSSSIISSASSPNRQ